MSFISDLVERIRTLVFRRSEERELDEELRFHLDMETEHQARLGAPPGEARRRGHLALGRVEQVKDEVRDARGTRFLEELWTDFRYAGRTLLRAPGFTAIGVATLSFGIGGTTAIFSAVDAVLIEPLPYREPGQLVRLYQGSIQHKESGFVTPIHFAEYRRRLGSFDGIAATYTYSEANADIGGSERPERIHLLPVSSDYFNVVRVEPAIGRPFAAAEENGAPLVVLSDQLWRREFRSDRAALGRSFTMSGRPYTVVGVMPAGFSDPIARRVDAWVPIDLSTTDPSDADNHFLTVVARLKGGVALGQAESELATLDQGLEQQYPVAARIRAWLAPLKQDLVGPASRSLEIMMGAVVLVLLLVCVNLANLLLVRGSERARELALRGALGASRGRLVRRLVIESLTLALIGDLAGLVVAHFAMKAIVQLAGDSIPRLTTLSLEPGLLLVSLGVATVSAIGFGLAPAIRSARAAEAGSLIDQGRSRSATPKQQRYRTGLVVVQVALAFVLLVGAGVLISSFRRLRTVELGIAPAQVLTFDLALPPARYDSVARARFYDEFARRLEQVPGVRAAGGISRLPATGLYHMWGTRPLTGPLAGDPRGGASPTPQQRVVSGRYFDVVGIRLLAGRFFDAEDRSGAPNRVIVSQSLANQIFPRIDPIGQRLSAGGREAEVIGVVSDAAVNPEGLIQPYVYHAHSQFAARQWELSQVIAAVGAPETVEAGTRQALANLDPELVMFRPMSLESAIGRGTASRVFTLQILSTFAVVALGLSALGLFGVLSYVVKLRSREFGIRMALGAARGRIRADIIRQGVAVTAIGVGVGLIGAVAFSRMMTTLVFQVSPLDPPVLLAGGLFTIAVGAGAAYLPAHRATVVDPRTVLQQE